MTDTMIYSQQYNDNFYYHDSDSEQFSSFHNFILPTQHTEKPQRRPSFSTLLQKKTSLMGRKLSIFSRQKKPQLKLMIPMTAQDNNTTQLERMDTSASNSTDGDGPVTPTSSTSPASSFFYNNDKRAFTVSSQDLESAITTPNTASNTLMDYSGKGYSNFYIKLPNGNWMVRVRDGNRKIVGTFEIDGSMI